MDARTILASLIAKHKGDWGRVMLDVRERNAVGEGEETKPEDGFIAITDREYPERVKLGFKPPFGLYTKGDARLLCAKAITSFVGSDDCLSDEDLRLIVGKAESAIAVYGENRKRLTETAKACGKWVIAVCGKPLCDVGDCGADLLVSLLPTGAKPSQDSKTRDNRFLGSLCTAVFGLEIGERSPDMQAVMQALQNGRDISVIPMPFGTPAENNGLIRDGAEIII